MSLPRVRTRVQFIPLVIRPGSLAQRANCITLTVLRGPREMRLEDAIGVGVCMCVSVKQGNCVAITRLEFKRWQLHQFCNVLVQTSMFYHFMGVSCSLLLGGSVIFPKQVGHKQKSEPYIDSDLITCCKYDLIPIHNRVVWNYHSRHSDSIRYARCWKIHLFRGSRFKLCRFRKHKTGTGRAWKI